MKNYSQEILDTSWLESYDYEKGEPLYRYLNGEDLEVLATQTNVIIFGEELRKLYQKCSESFETPAIICRIVYRMSEHNARVFQKWLRFFYDRYDRLDESDKLLWGLAEVCSHDDENLLKDLSEDETNLAAVLLDLMLDDKFGFVCYSTVRKLLSFVAFCVRFEPLKLDSYGVLKNVLPREISNELVITLFRQIFEIYHGPSFMTSQFEYLNPKEAALMIELMQGSVLHRLDLPWLEKVSKKENYIFSNLLAPEGNEFFFGDDMKNIVNRGIVYSKILKSRPQNIDCFWQMVMYSPTLQRDLSHVKKNLNFWQGLYLFLADNTYVNFFEGYRVGEVIDYFEDVVVRDGNSFQFKGRTKKSIMRLVERWHQEQSMKELEEVEHVTWPGMNIGPFYGELDGVKVKIEEITTAKELHQEGRELQHCVFSYLPGCIEGKVKLFSMKILKEEKWCSNLTIEISNKGKLKQVSGFKNRPITDPELDVIKTWIS